MSLLAIDFGGTRSRAALFSDDLQLVRRVEMPSQVDQPQEQVIARLIDLARQVADDSVRAIGICAPGPLDAAAGVIRHARTLPGWHNVPLARYFSEAFGGIPTVIENDANLAAVAEYRLGAAQGADPMIYLTLSTGIGGGAIIGGKLFTGYSGLAIEPGHMRFSLPDGKVYRLEELASGTALGRMARERLLARDDESVLRSVAKVDGRTVGEAALNGDVFAREIVSEAGYWLGLGVVNLLHLFNPQAVVLGGSVARLGDVLLNPVRAAIDAHILDPLFNPPNLIRRAHFGDDVCLVGAALYAGQRVR